MKVSKASSVFSSSIYSLSLLKTELYGREQPAVLVTHEYNLLEQLRPHSSVMTWPAPRTNSVFISFGISGLSMITLMVLIVLHFSQN